MVLAVSVVAELREGWCVSVACPLVLGERADGSSSVGILLAARIPLDAENRAAGVDGAHTPVLDVKIRDIRCLLARPEPLERVDYVEEGDWVEIIRGGFSGVRGRLLRRPGHRMVVGVELIRQAVSVEIESTSERPVTDGAGRSIQQRR